MSDNLKNLFGYLKYYKFNLFIVFCALFVVAISLLKVGVIFRDLVDQGLSNNELSSINNSILLISLLIVIFAIGSFFRSYFINLIAEKIIAQIKIDSCKKLLTLNISVFEDFKVGDIISRLSSDLDLVATLITNFLSFFLRNSIMLIGAIILMFCQSVKLSSIIIIIIPIIFLPIIKLSKNIRNISKKVMEEKASIISFIEENFSAIKTVYSFNQQNNINLSFDKKINSYLGHSDKRLKIRSLFFALAISMIAAVIIMVIWIGSLDIINGKMTSGEMISFIYYAIIAGASAGGIAELFSEAQHSITALDRVFAIKTYDFHKIDKLKNLQKLGNISFQNVKFAYPARADIFVLDDINFTIKKNQFTGIVGKSGSGKTTIMQLLLNFYQHQSGKISIGENIINCSSANAIRKVIGYAPQNPTIFSGTIKENIKFSAPDISDEEIQHMIRLCGIDSFSDKLINGIDSEVGEKATRLSGGQKQRIAIARALLYKPEILLLDEATNALDNESEREIIKNIRNFMHGKTIIAIAHRISSIKDADGILVIDNGKLNAEGNHDELIKKSGLYLSLYKKSKDYLK